MKDPTRLRDAKSPHSRVARDLLRSAVGHRSNGSGATLIDGPTSKQRDAMWASLTAAIGPVPSGSGGEPGPGDAGAGDAAPMTKGAFTLSAAKVWLALGIGGVASVGAAWYVAEPPADRAPLSPTVVAAKTTRAPQAAPVTASAASELETKEAEVRDAANPKAPVAPPSAARAEPRQAAPSTSGSEATRAPVGSAPSSKVVGTTHLESASSSPEVAVLSATERASRLRDEVRATASARAALRSGDPAGALAQLEGAQQVFGAGSMGQEREALIIEALGRSGARDMASARASAFVARWPGSAYAATIRAFIVEPTTSPSAP